MAELIDVRKTARLAMYQLAKIAGDVPDKNNDLMDMSMGIAFLFGYIEMGVQKQGQEQTIADIVDRGLEILGITEEGEVLV